MKTYILLPAEILILRDALREYKHILPADLFNQKRKILRQSVQALYEQFKTDAVLMKENEK